MFHTTFALAYKAGACTESYRAVGNALGGIQAYGQNTPIPLTRILELRGLEDTLWCLQCVLPEEKAQRDIFSRLLACAYAEHVAHLWVAPPGVAWKPTDTIKVARRFALGQATEEELAAAWDAAGAAWAAGAARAAAWDADWAAGEARNAAWAAAGAAAGAAAWAAGEARNATWDAAWAAGEARNATWEAEKAWQETKFREMLEAA